MKYSTLCQSSAITKSHRRCYHRGISSWIFHRKWRLRLIQSIQGISIESKLSTTAIDTLIILYPFLLVIITGRILCLWCQKIEVVKKKSASMLPTHLQNFISLLSKSARSIFFEILEHHTVCDELSNKHIMLIFS